MIIYVKRYLKDGELSEKVFPVSFCWAGQWYHYHPGGVYMNKNMGHAPYTVLKEVMNLCGLG